MSKDIGENATEEPGITAPRIVVVGTCASGKSTLVEALQAHGLDAYACGQEHSEIKTLWKHLNPNFVVFLETDLETVRARREPNWPELLFERQRARLQGAREIADVVIDTSTTDVSNSVESVLKGIANSGEFGRIASEPIER